VQLLDDTKHKLISTHSQPIKRNTQNGVGSNVAYKNEVKLCISNYLANAKPCELQKEAANKDANKIFQLPSKLPCKGTTERQVLHIL